MARTLRSAALTCGASILLVTAACTSNSTGEKGANERHASSTSQGPDHDYAQFARNILPHGQYGAVPPPAAASTQAKMYDALTPLFDNVTAQDLQTDFKSEVFGVGGDGPATSEAVPRPGVTILRDRYHVPHVTATTYDGGIWASGWIAAEDRGLLLEQARYNSRVAAVGVPGMQALDLISNLQNFQPSTQTEHVLSEQSAVLEKAGAKGRAVLHDIDTFSAGVNAYFGATHSSAKPWTRNDTFALEALKGQFVGQGGGDEARRTEFLSALQARLGTAKGMSVFNDLRQHDDAEQPTSIDGNFPYEPIPASPSGNVIIDPNSYKQVSPPGGPVQTPQPAHASNELMIDAAHSATGHPLLVGGPQIGYFYPGLTYEIDMHAPGLVWRGATSAPFPGYMLIGRGADFATTLTSADGDIIDQYAETLCGGSDTKYIYQGKCLSMGTFDAGILKGSNGAADQKIVFHTTVHGPVTGYATVKGRKIAISSKRSSYGKDALDLLLYHDLSTGAVNSPQSFFAAASQSPQTFNSFYVDSQHIAEYTSGLLPIRPASLDPGLLTDGTGNEEWQGFIGADAHPHGTDPARGRIVNWNNNVAHGFGAADDQWMRAGSVGRVDLLNKNLDRLESNGKWTLATVTSAMNAAATQDVRAIDTVPLLARLLDGSQPPNARDGQMLSLLKAWNAHGGSRLDRNGDGKIDDPGAAIMDSAWPSIANALLSPVLGPLVNELNTLVPRFEQPPEGQYSGWYQYFDKDIRALLGDKVTDPFANHYCGAGSKAACQQAIWAALDAAGTTLAAKQGSNPTAWRSSATAERITFIPGILQTTMRYTNRPTGIQQVISFDGHR
jgi:acyl-homoserine lactone acylase PvdQ